MSDSMTCSPAERRPPWLFWSQCTGPCWTLSLWSSKSPFLSFLVIRDSDIAAPPNPLHCLRTVLHADMRFHHHSGGFTPFGSGGHAMFKSTPP
eukprot:CAMPEP_0119303896 /NCGR_PEP_ID=MMETSP1333-20130426/5257_1 /TAXON_ID=418940 /ORGANISM="Scyphosphaera apsteinii, Strain RCC1455" /LENGTH=92 /DNA_ID=CAMNT_0007306675 /DNA_START=315 /DNA_END=589 /DNA_ORIENTATION=-